MLNQELNEATLVEDLSGLLENTDADTFVEALETALQDKAAGLKDPDAEIYRNIALELQELRRRDFAYTDEN